MQLQLNTLCFCIWPFEANPETDLNSNIFLKMDCYGFASLFFGLPRTSETLTLREAGVVRSEFIHDNGDCKKYSPAVRSK